ncbi:RNA-directed RNA polymerase [ssRNA phage SRR6960799_6]|uniref:RNA-directed RNA polymerase n=1 Tax=ssRNA phage SRR6960799_6 TaxID=2786602 RepID=A0A8S5KXZ8_9VIRU|nr:RNA-directed RNA polymerase [ssRNA phage SRR6960799_6]DAD50654.1 TPA_asm: RNA-directed RNA polymerase [ssRNA phage SRR6960799_6]
MSFSRNQAFQAWKAVEDHLRSLSFTCYGRAVEGADADTLSQCFTLWALTMRDLCGVSRLRYPKRFVSWFNQLANHPLENIVSSLKVLTSFTRDYNHDMGDVVDFTAFKRLFSEMGDLHRLLVEPFGDWWCEFLRDPRPSTFRVVLTCLEFPGRMTLIDLPEVLDIEKAKYLELERAQDDWCYPAALISDLREIVQTGLITLSEQSFLPSHGSGAVSDCRGRDREAKTKVLLHDGLTPRLHHYFCQHGISHPFANMNVTAKGRYCRVIFVPKGMTSKRVISAEPTCNMWFQQFLLRTLKDWLPTSYFRVTMEDQSRNRELAQEGSLLREYATIDLTSASDSITESLVRALFQGHWLWDALWSCRSTRAMVGNTLIPLNKFAPMGSAVCFPIMCIVFSAIVLLAQERAGVHSKFAVYGDDIVCHTSCFQNVLQILQDLHFSVNEKKTFPPESPFKESCGGEYYYGDDVTPLRIPRFFSGWRAPEDVQRSPRLFASWCSLANTFWALGLCETRAFFVRRFLDVCPSAPFSYEGRYQAIQTHDVSNWHVAEKFETDRSRIPRYKPNYCRGRIIRAFQVRTVTKPGADDIRYQLLLEAYENTRRDSLTLPADLIDMRVGPSQEQCGTFWIPEIYLLGQVAFAALPAGRMLCLVTTDAEWRLVVS